MQEGQGQGSSLRQRIGSLLQNLGGRGTSSRIEETSKPEQVSFLTEDILRELGPETPLLIRIRAIKDFSEIVATKRLEHYGVQAAWLLVKDLLEAENQLEVRHTVLGFLQCLVAGQCEELGILRAHFFRVIQLHNVEEDFELCFDVIRTLTDSGKNIEYIEQEIGLFMSASLSTAVRHNRSIECLTFLVNLIKCNSTYVEEEDLVKMINECCQLITSSKSLPVNELSLEVINSVICYSSLPSSSLKDVVITLCNTLNVTSLRKQSLEIILRLLGTHLGHAAIFCLCSILQDRTNWSYPLILRGAVFYISMSLWGSRKVETLKVSFGSVLPSMKEASRCPHTIVIYEIALSLLRLVRTYSSLFHSTEWDCVYYMLDHIQAHLVQLDHTRADGENNVLVQVVYDIFSFVSNSHSDHPHNPAMDSDKFYAVVNKAVPLHQLSLVIKLLSHQVNSLDVGGADWIDSLNTIMNRFYTTETVTAIRLEALEELQVITSSYLLCYEAELLEGVVLPLLLPVADSNDEDVCCRAVQLLVSILSDSTPQWAPPIIGIINTVFQKGLQLVAKRGEEHMLPGSKAAVFGLTPLFKTKLNCTSDVAAQIFHLLVNYLQQQIEEECFVPATCVMRIKIFNCLLSLRASEEGWIGYLNDEGQDMVYSPFYACEKSRSAVTREDGEQEFSSSTGNEVLLNCGKIFSAILSCLAKEREWAVLVEVLVGLNNVLQDRKLTVSSLPNLSVLCRHVCHIADNHLKWVQERLKNVPTRHPAEEELIGYLYPVLSSLCTYGSHLDRMAQNSLICCLEKGVVSSSSLLCIRALTIATLEMQPTMTRLLPKVLHRIGQVSATPTMAIPVLELLMSIIGFPVLFGGFVEKQYLGVFGIAIPYTDPSKYNGYVTALAHHVVSMWFIRCRIQYRPAVAKFINKSLSYLLSVSKDPLLFNYPNTSPPANIGTDSTSRKRSLSFTLITSHNLSSSSVGGGGQRGGEVGVVNSQLIDMVDVCVDMMSRYSYSNISTQPFRSPAADFLVGLGPSKTWLLGNALVTITASGSGGGAPGVCQRCQTIRRSLKPDPDILLASNESYDPAPSLSHDPSLEEAAPPTTLCSCWCRGWAEIKIRRPTGNVSWLMRIQNKMDILATPQPSATEYDWSLLGLNKDVILEEEEEEGEESEWGILTIDNEEEEEGEEVIIQEPFHSTINQPHDESSDQSHDQCGDQSHDQSGDQRGDQSHDQSDDQGGDQSHDQSGDHQLVDDGGSGNESHDQSIITISNVDDDDDANTRSRNCQAHGTNTDTNAESQDQSHDVKTESGITLRQPSSYSWSESGATETPLVSGSRSYSLSVPMESLPPLFSYDEGHLLGLSPSLVSNPLSDPEQLELIAASSLSQPSHEDVYTCSSGSSTSNSSSIESNSREERGGEEEDPEAPLLMSSNIKEETHHNEDVFKNADIQTEEAVLSTHSSPSKGLPSSSPKDNDHTPLSSVPRTHRRVMFSQTPPTSGRTREDMSADVFNNPSFIFLQLYHSSSLGLSQPAPPKDTPLLLPATESIERALKVLDHIPPYNTHKIGVVYVGKEQTTEQEILCNTSGSLRYLMFLRGLGRMINLKECPPSLIYLGGLDTSGIDGEYACFWEDDITQVIFHVATLLPTLPSNASCSNKKLHIGNDFVTIIYNESKNSLEFGLIKGQFNYAEVIIQPLPCSMNKVYLLVKNGLESFVDCSPSLVSDKWLPVLVRQKALLANLASLVLLSESTTDHYPSNWLGRLHQIKHIRERTEAAATATLQNNATASAPGSKGSSPTVSGYNNIPDFTLYCS
uniref:Rap-GAP domain-containing protein n=1 Tax=Amphimedon queenslandica TaxID=400682 RepID=A0A1X7VTP7_AMPQE